MVIFSLILSFLVLLLVVRLTLVQKRFDILNGALIVGAMTVVVLDVDTIMTERRHSEVAFISIAVLILWFISMTRKAGKDT